MDLIPYHPLSHLVVGGVFYHTVLKEFLEFVVNIMTSNSSNCNNSINNVRSSMRILNSISAASTTTVAMNQQEVQQNNDICHCFVCDLMTNDIAKGIVSEERPGKKCICKSVFICTSCWNQKRRCSNCQIFCDCYQCNEECDPMKKVKMWTISEGTNCSICQRVNISVECNAAERICATCTNSMINDDGEDETGGLFDEDVADNNHSFGGYELVPKVPVPLEILNSSATNTISRTQAAKENLLKKKAKGRKKPLSTISDELSPASPRASSNMHNTSSASTLIANNALSQLRQTTFTSFGVLPQQTSSLLVQSPVGTSIVNTTLTPTEANISSLTSNTRGSDNQQQSNSAAVADRALSTNNSADEDCDDLLIKKKRRRTSYIWQYGEECVVVDKGTGLSFNGYKCHHCGWIGKYSSSTTGAAKHLKFDCVPLRSKFLRSGDNCMDSTTDNLSRSVENSPTIGNRTISQLSTSGTSTINTDPKKQTVLFRGKDGTVSFQRPKESLNPVILRGVINDMILVDELPFEFVEKKGFRNLLSFVTPNFKPFSRRTVKEDIVLLMTPQRKQALRTFLQTCIEKENTGFSFTTDIYTNTTQKKAYMSVTVHFIMRGHNWTLYNTLLGFEQIESPHTGHNIASKFSKIVSFYGLNKNVFSCTLDNAGNNDTFVNSMHNRKREIPLMLEGEFFHVRCNAHCYNLIAQDGIKLLREPLADIRTFIKCIRTPKSHEEFERHISEDRNSEVLCKKARPSFDVRTRWNSTYDMIASVLPYAEVIDTMSHMTFDDVVVDPETNELRSSKVTIPVFPPEFWTNLEDLKQFLKPLKDTTEMLSARKTPTAHLVVGEVQILKETIDRVGPLEEQFVNNAADKMATKFAKYYSNLPKAFIIAHILDPRAKTKFVELMQLDEEGNDLVTLCNDTIRVVFDKFFKGPPTQVLEKSSPMLPEINGQLVGISSYQARLALLSKVNQNSIQTGTERELTQQVLPDDLQVYLSEPLVPYEANEHFDILLWWRKNEYKFPKLVNMATLFLGKYYAINNNLHLPCLL